MIGPSIWSIVKFADIPHDRILVADDSRNPMAETDRKRLEGLGVTVVATDFARKKNLNGLECVKGVLNTLQLAAQRFEATHVLKIDPDTMLFSRELVDRLENGAIGSIGGAAGDKPNRFFYGMSYILRRDVIERLIDFVSKADIKDLIDIVDGSERFPEDYTISGICSAISPSTHVTIPFTRGRGFHCSWPYGKKNLSTIQTITSFSSIHFGQWHLIESDSPARKRLFAGSVMTACQKMLEEWESNTSTARKCVALSFGGFDLASEAGAGVSFTPGFNSTYLYDLLPTLGNKSPMLSAWIDQEFCTTNNEGVDWVDSKGERHQEQVEVHVYRSAWSAPEFFLKPSPGWYRGGLCALVSFEVDGKKTLLPFHELSITDEGIPVLRDNAGRTIMVARTEEKIWGAQEDVDNQEVQ